MSSNFETDFEEYSAELTYLPVFDFIRSPETTRKVWATKAAWQSVVQEFIREQTLASNDHF